MGSEFGFSILRTNCPIWVVFLLTFFEEGTMSESQEQKKKGGEVDGGDSRRKQQWGEDGTMCLGTDTFIHPIELARIARQYSNVGCGKVDLRKSLFC